MDNKRLRQKIRGCLLEFMTQRDLDGVEDFADALFKDVGVDIEFSRHFTDRLNDPRNGKDIESKELMDLFAKTYVKYGQKIPNYRKGTEAVINDLNTNINIPFALNWDKQAEQYVMVSKTIMRKKNFHTQGMKLKV
jgi:hypothetical protein